MADSINGFTGFGKRDPNFVSARDAMRRAEAESRATASDPYLSKLRADAQHAQQAAAFMSAAEAPREPAAGLRNADIFKFMTEGEDGIASFDPQKLAAIPQRDRRWSWVEVDLGAIRHNARAVKAMLPHGTRLMAVVKADGYGHGAVQCAKTALNSGAEYLGVATVDEAIELREALINAPILILAQPPRQAIPLLLAYKVMPSIYTPDFAIAYAEAADACGIRAPFHLKINTGMNRIGVHYTEVAAFMQQIGFHRALDLVGTFTHFATADCSDTLDFKMQLKRFVEAVDSLRGAGFDPGIVHCANSAAAIRYPESRFDMVRLGIGLYGFQPCMETYPLIDLIPAMSVKARITDTRPLPVGEGVSYGLNYRSPGSVKVCTIPIGYADGLRRGLSGRTDFIVGGTRMPQVGNICMDQCMFSVDLRTYATRRRPDPQVGDEVVVVGSVGDAAVTIDEMCATLNTIPHEVAIGFGTSRMPRIYT